MGPSYENNWGAVCLRVEMIVVEQLDGVVFWRHRPIGNLVNVQRFKSLLDVYYMVRQSMYMASELTFSVIVLAAGKGTRSQPPRPGRL